MFARRKIIRLQEDIEFMDRRAQDLYRKLVKLIGADEGQDRLEVDHIIKLVGPSATKVIFADSPKAFSKMQSIKRRFFLFVLWHAVTRRP